MAFGCFLFVGVDWNGQLGHDNGLAERCAHQAGGQTNQARPKIRQIKSQEVLYSLGYLYYNEPEFTTGD